jgi:secreted trypsin-like serine protease
MKDWDIKKKSKFKNWKYLFQGDSGGPLIQYIDGRGHLLGIENFIGRIKSRPTHVYAQVSKYVKWIEDTIKLS